MRDIKFRAWDKSKKFMINNFHTKHVFKTVLNKEDEYYFDYAIMQSTGLLDKNGKDIYEKDYIKIINPDGEEIEEQMVHYSSDGGYFIEDDGDYYPIGYAIKQGYKIEIVGCYYD